MKKSEVKKLISECVQEVLAEAALYSDVRNFIKTIDDPKLQTVFANWIVPVLSKSAEELPDKVKYINSLRSTILDPNKAPAWMKAHLERIGVDIHNPKTIAVLTKFLPIISKFEQFVSNKK